MSFSDSFVFAVGQQKNKLVREECNLMELKGKWGTAVGSGALLGDF